MLRIGEQVGAYQIVEQLGQGGMATVYKAYHPQLDRFVAIKVMHQNFLEDSNFRSRFEREAQIVARLEHPHIVPTYDFNQHHGQPYLVMKLIEGKTLKQLALKAPLTLQQILNIFTAVGSALTYAHQKGVLHRDIKPSNIVIDVHDTSYLADFGLARIVQAGESTMSADMLLGTPHYISPEQARGQKDIDGRTDIYSLGVVLYELLVGRVPFTADTPYAIIHDHIYSPLPLPSVINPEITPSVEAVLLKALEKAPQDRYATADEFVKAFQDAIDKTQLKELNPERSSIASKNLEKSWPAMTASASSYLPSATAVLPPLTSGLTPATLYKKNSNGRLWMLGGCAGFILTCLLAIAIVLSALDSILQIAELTNSFSPEISTELEITNFIYSVPEVPLASALEYTTNQPDDPIGYLALTRAYWQQGANAEDAINALRDGAGHESDLARYFATAAILADSVGRHSDSFAYTILASEIAQSNNDNRPEIRNIVGQLSYNSAENLSLNDAPTAINIIREVGYSEIAQRATETQLYKFFALRQRIVNNQLLLAQRAFSNLSTAEQNLPEVRLLYAELLLKQGSQARALGEITQLLALENSPNWVKTKATQLLETIER